ncbi:MAG: glycosyltransferase family 4 protein [SAR324 cluster bacterium]|uniref:Glycosyltransferase family 4 protein n=1 Tax=SAR324 cluster bacterium TaxID=2024889 RepID=A0A7X9FQH2_9DELT|nr:glycosyltransferase family 4 protein [SAR324 cluster bacterium]
MKVAIVHDWLTGMRGGEKCLFAFLSMYPEADIFTLVHIPGSTNPFIDSRVVKTSFLQKLPFAGRFYRYFLPLYPTAIKAFSFEGYDLVISLSHAAAKNIRVPSTTEHICYCFTPMRYIWDQADVYFGGFAKPLSPILSYLRKWDRENGRADKMIAISNFVKERIQRYYNRDSQVVYPPVDTSFVRAIPELIKGESFLCAGALVPYKRIAVAIQAFNLLGIPLWIAGTGPEEAYLRSIAGKNVLFFGRVNDEELASLYAHCRALIFPGVEDFGMIPIECMAAGRPVIARQEGGSVETVNGVKCGADRGGDLTGKTGVFYEARPDAEVASLMEAVGYFMTIENELRPEACVAQAKKFSPERFFSSWESIVGNRGEAREYPLRSAVLC